MSSDPFSREQYFICHLDAFLSTSNVRRLLMTSGKKSAAIVLTRPPETITCVKISIPDDIDVFMVFDSHPRQDHPNGAGLIFSTSIDLMARYLDNLLSIDESILTDRSLQWQTQLLVNFSGLLFVAKTTRFNSDAIEAERAMIESSLTILALQAEVAELRFQNTGLQEVLQTAELKLEEERWNSYRSPIPPKRSGMSSESGWIPTPSRKKHRQKKSDNGSSSPTDYRPSIFGPIRATSTRTYLPVFRPSSSTHLLQR